MQKLSVIGQFGLQSVAERMTEIQQTTTAGLGFIGSDDLCLGFAADPNGVCHRLIVAVQRPLSVLFQPDEEFRSVDRAVFNNFGITSQPLACR